MVTTMMVSTNTPIMATTPCSCGSFTSASAWACGVEPMPASLENRPRLAPWLMAAMIPKVAPPTVASGLKAHWKMSAKVAGMLAAFMMSTTSDPST